MSDASYIDVGALCVERERDEVFSLLSNSRRRSVLYVLYRSGEAYELSELVAEVASCETGALVDNLDDEVTQSIYISLYQTHLPKLTEFGLVEYDDDTRVVSLTSRGQGVLVPADLRSTPRWHRYYAALLLGGLVAGGAAWSLSGTDTWQLVSLFVLTGLCGIVVAHTWSMGDADTDGSYLSVDDLV